jgi:hypothetical protein
MWKNEQLKNAALKWNCILKMDCPQLLLKDLCKEYFQIQDASLKHVAK